MVVWLGLVAVLGVGLVPAVAGAKAITQIVPGCNPIPGRSGSCGIQHLFELVQNVYNIMLGLAGLVAVLFIVWAGIRMILYWVSEKPEEELTSAKLTLRRAVTGLVIIAVAYLAVSFVLAIFGFQCQGIWVTWLGDLCPS